MAFQADGEFLPEMVGQMTQGISKRVYKDQTVVFLPDQETVEVEADTVDLVSARFVGAGRHAVQDEGRQKLDLMLGSAFHHQPLGFAVGIRPDVGGPFYRVELEHIARFVPKFLADRSDLLGEGLRCGVRDGDAGVDEELRVLRVDVHLVGVEQVHDRLFDDLVPNWRNPARKDPAGGDFSSRPYSSVPSRRYLYSRCPVWAQNWQGCQRKKRFAEDSDRVSANSKRDGPKKVDSLEQLSSRALTGTTDPVGVVQGSNGASLALEPLPQIQVSGEGVRQDLQRDLAVELGVGGLPDLRHTALAEAGADLQGHRRSGMLKAGAEV